MSPAGVVINANEKIIGGIDERALKGQDATKATFFALRVGAGEVIDGTLSSPTPLSTFASLEFILFDL